MTVTQTGQGGSPSPSPRPRPEQSAEGQDPDVTPPDTGRPQPPDDGTPPTEAVTGRGPVPFLIALIAAVLCFLLAITFGVLWFVERHSESEREEALAAAKVYAVDLTTYNYDKIDENFDKVRSNSTEKFSEMYSQVSKQLTDLLRKYQADSKGDLLNAGVAEFDGDKAVVVLIIDTTITNTNSPQPRIDRNRMVMTLLEVDGEWKLDQVALT